MEFVAQFGAIRFYQVKQTKSRILTFALQRNELLYPQLAQRVATELNPPLTFEKPPLDLEEVVDAQRAKGRPNRFAKPDSLIVKFCKIFLVYGSFRKSRTRVQNQNIRWQVVMFVGHFLDPSYVRLTHKRSALDADDGWNTSDSAFYTDIHLPLRTCDLVDQFLVKKATLSEADADLRRSSSTSQPSLGQPHCDPTMRTPLRSKCSSHRSCRG
jgi:hypothetical protein